MLSILVQNPTEDDIPSPALKRFLAIWGELEAKFCFPQRKHFTFQILKEHLPDISIMDYAPDTGRLKVSLMGTRYTDLLGQELTGSYIDELPNTKEMRARCKWLIDNGLPYFASHNPLDWAERTYKSYSTLGVPIFGQDQRVCKILFCVAFEPLSTTA